MRPPSGLQANTLRPLLGALTLALSLTSVAAPSSLTEWLASIDAADAEPALTSAGFHTAEALLSKRPSEPELKALKIPMKLRKRLAKGFATVREPTAATMPGSGALRRRDGVAVGHRQRWALEDGRDVEAETLSLQPLVRGFRSIYHLIMPHCTIVYLRVPNCTELRLPYTCGCFCRDLP